MENTTKGVSFPESKMWFISGVLLFFSPLGLIGVLLHMFNLNKADVTPERGWSILFLLFFSMLMIEAAGFAFVVSFNEHFEYVQFTPFEPIRHYLAFSTVAVYSVIYPLMFWVCAFCPWLFPPVPAAQQATLMALNAFAFLTVLCFLVLSVRRYFESECLCTFRSFVPGRRVALLTLDAVAIFAYSIFYDDTLFLLAVQMVVGFPMAVFAIEVFATVLIISTEGPNEISEWLSSLRLPRTRRGLSSVCHVLSCLCRDKTAPQVLYT